MSMTSVMTLDLNSPDVVKATLIAGNTQTVYMSNNRLYLIGSQYLNNGTSYTQVTSLDPLNPTKPVVSRVLGYPLGQYAYHQDTAGKLYLVSQGNRTSDNKSVTHVWSLNKDGSIG
jgi:hypothetical protein